MTATVAGSELTERLNALMSRMPGYPHRTLDVRLNEKKQGTRLLKIVCPACGYTARTTRQWIDRGLPTCHCGTSMGEEPGGRPSVSVAGAPARPPAVQSFNGLRADRKPARADCL